MSQSNKATFEDFLKIYDNKHKYLISTMTIEYNKMMGTDFSSEQFLALPEVQKHFDVYYVECPPLLYMVCLKKKY